MKCSELRKMVKEEIDRLDEGLQSRLQSELYGSKGIYNKLEDIRKQLSFQMGKARDWDKNVLQEYNNIELALSSFVKAIKSFDEKAKK